MKKALTAVLAMAAGLLAVAIVWVAVQPGFFARTGQLCDGSVPVWYPSEGGCTEVPSLVEHLWPPERWGAPSFCQGMCLASMDEIEEQVRIRDEWRAAHPEAIAH
jgi:hypothetical protein